MPDLPDYRYDAATALAQGRRDRQEDAVFAHFPDGGGMGYAVLADGMGGHAAGDIASAAVVEAINAMLQPQTGDSVQLEAAIDTVLRRALRQANGRIAELGRGHPARAGMGSTLIAPVIVGNRLYWVSVGDSPLYLLRGRRLTRLNEDHSMARQIEILVQNGRMTQEDADRHPDRDCVTSVLQGTVIADIDCHDVPFDLMAGDIVLAASDGLQIIDDGRIAGLLQDHRAKTAAEICAALLAAVSLTDDPDQDNVSVCVIKISAAAASAAPQPRLASSREPAARPATLTRTTVHLNLRRKDKDISCQFSSVREG